MDIKNNKKGSLNPVRKGWRYGLLAAVVALAGCVTETPKPQFQAATGPSIWAEPQVYECGKDVSFTIAFELNQAWLMLPGRNVKLLPEQSPAGLQYKGEGVIFWAQEGEAMLVTPTERHVDCRIDPRATVWATAKLRGVDYRGIGNEPGWYVEIYDNERIVLVTDYGTKWHELGGSPAEVNAAQGLTRYRTRYETQEVVIEIQKKACNDTMSDEQFETAVRAQIGARTYYGCGRFL